MSRSAMASFAIPMSSPDLTAAELAAVREVLSTRRTSHSASRAAILAPGASTSSRYTPPSASNSL